MHGVCLICTHAWTKHKAEKAEAAAKKQKQIAEVCALVCAPLHTMTAKARQLIKRTGRCWISCLLDQDRQNHIVGDPYGSYLLPLSSEAQRRIYEKQN